MTLNARMAAVVQKGDGAAAGQPNQRFARRKATHTSAKILWDGITTPFECTVKDISSTGAQLEMTVTKFNPDASPAALPVDFTLIIPLDRTAVECRSMWRKGKKVGVRFMSMVRPLAPAPKPMMVGKPGAASGLKKR